MRKIWMYDPHSGGTKIPRQLQDETRERILRHADEGYKGKFTRIDVAFRGALCYFDAYTEPAEPSPELLKITGETRSEYLERLRNHPTHLCRLRYLGPYRNAWSVAFFTYSHEKYEPTFFGTGEMEGTPEEGFDVGAVYLD
ncbi:MAG: hypothetical protein O2960_24075 [Verrucomicrobia bacterium]|nr:hypothetical protein [Verrucomicrobiota bacterium]